MLQGRTHQQACHIRATTGRERIDNLLDRFLFIQAQGGKETMQQTSYNRDRPTVAQQRQPEIIAAGGSRLRLGETLGSILERKTKDRLSLNNGGKTHVSFGICDCVLPPVLVRGKPVLVSTPPGNLQTPHHDASSAGSPAPFQHHTQSAQHPQRPASSLPDTGRPHSPWENCLSTSALIFKPFVALSSNSLSIANTPSASTNAPPLNAPASPASSVLSFGSFLKPPLESLLHPLLLIFLLTLSFLSLPFFTLSFFSSGGVTILSFPSTFSFLSPS